MQPVFEKPAEAEKYIKEKYFVPPYLMMENAAAQLSNEILAEWYSSEIINGWNFQSVIIICGKGNNGADGLACARRIYGEVPVLIFCPEAPKTEEGLLQTEMCKALKIPFISRQKLISELKTNTPKIILDCLYGTGFHGELSADWKEILNLANNAFATRIACDIPSGLYFKAHRTITMGTRKAILYQDHVKDIRGPLSIADLGFSKPFFENAAQKFQKSSIYLLEKKDVHLPERNKRNTHKGSFGHSVIISGNKSGAAIIASEAAMNFGSGLTSLLKTPASNLSQFKISPELMICEDFPKTTKAVQIGSGLGDTEKQEVQNIITSFENWWTKASMPGAVLDADILGYKQIKALLSRLIKVPDSRIVLTPHAKELANLVTLLDLPGFDKNISPASALKNRIEIGRAFTKKYPSCVLVMKGANTFIAEKGQIYIYESFANCLAKGGSGDVLAGMITSLLSQNYSALDAAITAVWRHGEVACQLGASSYNVTPKKLIQKL